MRFLEQETRQNNPSRVSSRKVRDSPCIVLSWRGILGPNGIVMPCFEETAFEVPISFCRDTVTMALRENLLGLRDV